MKNKMKYKFQFNEEQEQIDEVDFYRILCDDYFLNKLSKILKLDFSEIVNYMLLRKEQNFNALSSQNFPSELMLMFPKILFKNKQDYYIILETFRPEAVEYIGDSLKLARDFQIYRAEYLDFQTHGSKIILIVDLRLLDKKYIVNYKFMKFFISNINLNSDLISMNSFMYEKIHLIFRKSKICLFNFFLHILKKYKEIYSKIEISSEETLTDLFEFEKFH